MFRFRLAVLAILAVLLVPALASAQKKVRGEEKEDWKDVLNAAPTGTKLTARDVEDMSPVKLLVDKRKDLKLTDDQTKKLKDVEGGLKEKNKPLFKALDSLRIETKPKAVTPTDDDRTRMMIARHELAAVVKAIRASYDATLKDAMPILDETQQKRANELLQKQSKEADDMLREKLGGDTGSDDGAMGGRRGRPPLGE